MAEATHTDLAGAGHARAEKEATMATKKQAAPTTAGLRRNTLLAGLRTELQELLGDDHKVTLVGKKQGGTPSKKGELKVQVDGRTVAYASVQGDRLAAQKRSSGYRYRGDNPKAAARTLAPLAKKAAKAAKKAAKK